MSLAWPAPATHGDGFEELTYGFAFFSNRVRHRLVTELKIANVVETSYDHSRLGGFITVTVRRS